MNELAQNDRSNAGKEWSWVGEDGIEHPVSEAELSFALSSEELPAYTLVWKRGWPNWLPAMQVAELSWALPAGAADVPQKPQLSETGSRRPPPLAAYAELRQRAHDIVRGIINPQAQLASSPNVASSPSVAGLRREVTPGPSHVRARASEAAALSDDDFALDIAPARAPRTGVQQIGQQASHARGFSREDEDEPTMQIDAETLERDRLLTLIEGDVESLRDPYNYGPDSDSAFDVDYNGAAEPPLPIDFQPEYADAAPVHQTAALAAHPLVTRQAPAYVAPQPQQPTPLLETRTQDEVPPPSSSRLPFFAVAAALALGAVGALWLRSETPREEPAPAPSPKPVAPSVDTRIPNCSIGHAGTLLAEWLYPKLDPVAAPISITGKVAVGYAQTSRFAMGITLDPESLRIEKVFSEFQNSPLLSVTPMTASAALTFRTTRAAATLQSSIAVNTSKPFSFGWTRDGFAVRRDSATQDEVLWKSAFTTANVPSIARLDGGGFLFAIRAGGERGSLLLGKLSDAGVALSDLMPVKFPDGRLSTPTLKVGPTRALVAFTLGATETRGDVYLADSIIATGTGTNGTGSNGAAAASTLANGGVLDAAPTKLPDTARPLLLVREGVFSPQAVELTNSSFVLQYTRGEPGNQQIVAQTYGFRDFQKLGAEILVSPNAVDAHAGALFRQGKGFLSLYAVRNDQSYALWATRLDCD